MAKGHRTYPIPQVIPPAEGQAQAEPGVRSLQQPLPRPKHMARKAAFRTPVFPRVQNERGIDYGMNNKAEKGLDPTIPLPVRSSLAQDITVFRVQLSHYFRRIAGSTRFPGMAPGYPTAKTRSMINTAPAMRRNPQPVAGLRGYPARSGYMNAPRRFRKAIPLPVNDYQPPVYGQ